MNFPFYIARRYLLAKKSHNAINIITAISVTVVAVGTTALVIVLSVFNGLEGLLSTLYNSYKPDLNVTAAQGKYFTLSENQKKQLLQVQGVVSYAEVVEDMALLKYNNGNGEEDRQFVAKLKGVPENYSELCGIDTMLVDGDFGFQNESGRSFGVAGLGVYHRLNLRLSNMFTPIYAYYPNRSQKGAVNAMNAMDAFRIESFYPAGIFSVQQEVDDQLVYVSLDFARKLMQLDKELTAFELQVDESYIETAQEQVKAILGDAFDVKNQKEQNESLFKILKSEKWSSFLILSFILLIATFNIIGSITVLILEKKKDIISLRNMGADHKIIKRIFLLEGMLISISGSMIGLAVGAIFCWVQIHFGIIPMEGSFVVDSFPVTMKLSDFIIVFCLVIAIGFGATILPVNRISRQYLSS